MGSSLFSFFSVLTVWWFLGCYLFLPSYYLHISFLLSVCCFLEICFLLSCHLFTSFLLSDYFLLLSFFHYLLSFYFFLAICLLLFCHLFIFYLYVSTKILTIIKMYCNTYNTGCTFTSNCFWYQICKSFCCHQSWRGWVIGLQNSNECQLG